MTDINTIPPLGSPQAFLEFERRTTDRFISKNEFNRLETDIHNNKEQVEAVRKSVDTLNKESALVAYKLDTMIGWLKMIFWTIAIPLLSWGGVRVIEFLVGGGG